jgi:outer membrane protein TolC
MLRRFSPFVPVLAAVFACAAAGAQASDNAAAAEGVTLVEAVRAALADGRDVRLATKDVGIASAGETRAKAGRYPRLDASAEYIAYSEPPSAIILGNPVQTSDRRNLRTRLTLEQTLYDFGRTCSRVDQAAARSETAKESETLTRERQALQAIAAFLAARRAEELRKVASEALATAKDYRRVAGDQYELGIVARNDLLAADVAVANAESGVIVAENQVEISRSRLALRMGFPGDRSAAPSPREFPVPPEDTAALDNSVCEALARRAELRAQEAAVREGEARVSGARAEFAPSLFGQGGYSYETNEFNPHKSVFFLTVGGKVNLFSGFSDEAEKRQAILIVERRREELLRLKDEIALEVKSARLATVEAGKRKAVAEAAVARAEENLRIQNDRYKEGLSISTEVLEAQTLLTRAKVDRRNAEYDLHEARYRLLAARGELLPFLAPLLGAAR